MVLYFKSKSMEGASHGLQRLLLSFKPNNLNRQRGAGFCGPSMHMSSDVTAPAGVFSITTADEARGYCSI